MERIIRTHNLMHMPPRESHAEYFECNEPFIRDDIFDVIYDVLGDRSIWQNERWKKEALEKINRSLENARECDIDLSELVNYVYDDRTTLLNEAIDGNATEGVRLLLELGADPNVPDAGGNTALCRSIKYAPNMTIIYLLLDYDADPNQESGECAALNRAIFEDNLELVSLLFNYGGDPNFTNESDGRSLLDQAIIKNSWPIIERLVEAGATKISDDILQDPKYQKTINRVRDISLAPEFGTKYFEAKERFAKGEYNI